MRNEVKQDALAMQIHWNLWRTRGEVSPWIVTHKRVCHIERCLIYPGTHSFLEFLVHSLLSAFNCGGFVSNFPVVSMFYWAVVVQLPTTTRVLQETGWVNDKQEPYELTCVLGPATTPQQHLDKVNLAIDRQNEWVLPVSCSLLSWINASWKCSF